MCAIGIFEREDQRWTIDLLGIFFLFYLAGIVLFPAKQGPRYIFPIVAPVLIYTLRSIGYLAGYWEEGRFRKTAINGCLILGLIYNVSATAYWRNYNDDEVFTPDAREMTHWMRNNIPSAEHYQAWDPRAMAFLTGRIGMGLPSSAEEVALLCRRENVIWVVLMEGRHSKMIADLKDDAGFVEAWHNGRYHIFKYSPVQDSGRHP
jgi:hypothetical protein